METLVEVIKYEKTRYKHPDQRLVHYLEFHAIVKAIKRFLPENSHILDIPCGFGRFSYPLKKLGFRVTVADISAAMVLRTTEKVGVSGVTADITHLPFKNNSFDATLSVRLMQHLPLETADMAISELARVSKKFVFVTFYRENFLHRFERKLTGRKSGIQFYKSREFLKITRKHGLDLIQTVSPIGPIHAQTLMILSKSNF